jgi:hypothetical protein
VKPNMRRQLPGTFIPQDLGAGVWRLSRSEPGLVDVFVLGATPEAAQWLRARSLRDLDIEWREDCALLGSSADGNRATVALQGAIVHEPLPQLYAALPLAGLDEQARRFWRRVFRLVRIPGGRHLLGILARRSRRRG